MFIGVLKNRFLISFEKAVSCPKENILESDIRIIMIVLFMVWRTKRLRLGDVAVFENRQPTTGAKFITKSSLFIL